MCYILYWFFLLKKSSAVFRNSLRMWLNENLFSILILHDEIVKNCEWFGKSLKSVHISQGIISRRHLRVSLDKKLNMDSEKSHVLHFWILHSDICKIFQERRVEVLNKFPWGNTSWDFTIYNSNALMGARVER